MTVQFEEGQEHVPVYRSVDLPAYCGHVVVAIIEGSDSTIVVPLGLRFAVDTYGNITLRK